MSPPLLDFLIVRDGGAWRLYFAPLSWKPAQLGRVDGGSLFPFGRPDLAGLDRLLAKVGCRIERHPAEDGGVAIAATGRAALAVAAWLARMPGGGTAGARA